jgi:hypothetical protein
MYPANSQPWQTQGKTPGRTAPFWDNQRKIWWCHDRPCFPPGSNQNIPPTMILKANNNRAVRPKQNNRNNAIYTQNHTHHNNHISHK